MSVKYILKPAATLFLTAVIVIAFLSVVYSVTREPIERQRLRTQEAVKREVLPGAAVFREIPLERTGDIVAVFEGSNSQGMAGYVVELSTRGYSGNIYLMVGISLPDERIAGMRVMRHNETPGLGALAVKENFYRQYDGRDLVPLGVVRNSPGQHEIHAIASATITTRVITNAVNEAMTWYKDNRR